MTILDSWTHTSAPPLSEHTSNAQDDTSRTLIEAFCLFKLTPTVDSFNLPWDAVCNIFDGVYISWDPGIFEFEMTHHGTWTAGSMPLQNEGTHCERHRPGSIA